jgi:FMN phosphatase YigB (HAD superfamily)
MGIQKFFNPILISEEVGFAKPKPEFFLLASDLWHLPVDHVLVVGDRVDWEVVGAHDAHMQSGLVTEFVDNSKDIRPDLRPDFLIPRLEDLSRLVRSQNGS